MLEIAGELPVVWNLEELKTELHECLALNTKSDSCLILIAHGSRNPNWLVPFQKLTDDLKKDEGGDRVHLCFMEFASPSLQEMAEQLHRQGITHARLLPLFLASGSHLAEDVPAALKELKAQFPSLQIELLPPIGEDPGFAELLRGLVKQYVPR